MICPGCSAEMAQVELDKRLGLTVEIDLCASCRVIWFDRYEDLQLSPSATLKLFSMIGEHSKAAAAPLSRTLGCPRCARRLLHTHDLQRSTRFQYFRCGQDHGRLMTFVDFLRAKDFIRPLTPRQLAELRENVQVINCSNCGAPVDLRADSACGHCGSALSLLDVKQMARTIEQLQGPSSSTRLAAAPVPETAGEPSEMGALILALTRQRRDSPLSLIEAGLGMLEGFFKKGDKSL